MRVLVGISGGVDSAVAAMLLKKAGYEPIAVHLLLGEGEENANARKCAEYLGIEYHFVDMSEEFAKRVKTPFASVYLNGQTPNPCVICNREIKFGLMAELMEVYNCDKLATGHYVRSEYCADLKRWVLRKGKDNKKDQSYFLWSLSQKQLANTLFPLGEYTKEQVRQLALENGIPVAASAESQDVCFIPDGNCGEFIACYTGVKPVCGDFVDVNGNILGRHKGIAYYTVGQRKGLGISSDAPLYVIRKDTASNTVVLGSNDQLFSDSVNVCDVNLITADLEVGEIPVQTKIRYSNHTAEAVLILKGKEGVLKFIEPQRAPSPGQSAVFYDNDLVVGGGIIV